MPRGPPKEALLAKPGKDIFGLGRHELAYDMAHSALLISGKPHPNPGFVNSSPVWRSWSRAFRDAVGTFLWRYRSAGKGNTPMMPFRRNLYCLRIVAMAAAIFLNVAAVSHACSGETGTGCMIERSGAREVQTKGTPQPYCCSVAHCCALVPDCFAGGQPIGEADNLVARTIQPSPLLLIRALDPPPRSSFG